MVVIDAMQRVGGCCLVTESISKPTHRHFNAWNTNILYLYFTLSRCLSALTECISDVQSYSIITGAIWIYKYNEWEQPM